MSKPAVPRIAPPPSSCDCHIHVFDATAPASMPQWATAAAYRELSRRLGVDRVVLVQPNGLRTDNSILVAALAELGQAARGVAIVDASVTDEELVRLTRAGVRGARFHMLPGGMLSWDDLRPIAERIAPFGWHVQLQMDGRLIHEREAELMRLPVPLVVDHVGKFLEPVPVSHPGFAALLRLLDTGRCWLKLSAPYEVSRKGPPHYEDVGVLAKAAARAAPERMVWASNWPHLSLKADLPDDAMLLDLLNEWVPEERARHAVLVENPAALYGYSSPAPAPAVRGQGEAAIDR